MTPAVDFKNRSPALEASLRKTILNQDWRLANLYKIQTKEMKLMKFSMNPIQSRIHRETVGQNRIMHLKARQEGVSTYWLIRELDECLWTPNTTCAVIAHDRDTLEVLFEIVSRAYNNIPRVKIGDRYWEKPPADRSSTRMLKFERDSEGIVLDSKIYVDLSVRGGTIHRLHISEAGFIKDMNDVWAAVENSVPVESGRIVVESTANGKGNWFSNQWHDTNNAWHKMFFAWFDNPENKLNVPKDGPMWRYSVESVERSLSQPEKQMILEYDLTIPQICWYRFKIDSYDEGEKIKMKQENPGNAQEAFIHAVGRFFPEFSRTIHVIPNLKNDETPRGVNKFASLDYGWTNPSSIGLWYVDYDGNCIKFKEAYQSYWPIPEQCRWLKAHGFDKVQFCDPSMWYNTQQKNGKIETICDEYKRNGITLHKANNDKGAGIPRLREYLRLRDKHKNPATGTIPAPTLYVCEGCKETIREFEDIRYERPSGPTALNQTAKEDYEKTQKLSHAVDETRYFIVSRPRIPQHDEEVIPGTPGARLKRMESQKKVGVTY